MSEDRIPTLTDVVALEEPDTQLSAEELDELQAEVSMRVLRLAEELMHGAAREVEDVLFSRIFDQLRARLPGIVEQVLRERLIK